MSVVKVVQNIVDVCLVSVNAFDFPYGIRPSSD